MPGCVHLGGWVGGGGGVGAAGRVPRVVARGRGASEGMGGQAMVCRGWDGGECRATGVLFKLASFRKFERCPGRLSAWRSEPMSALSLILVRCSVICLLLLLWTGAAVGLGSRACWCGEVNVASLRTLVGEQVTDQFSRNMHRGTPGMFATDQVALATTKVGG